jgi:uncharacterized protein YndB with AHSA1/START domain
VVTTLSEAGVSIILNGFCCANQIETVRAELARRTDIQAFRRSGDVTFNPQVPGRSRAQAAKSFYPKPTRDACGLFVLRPVHCQDVHDAHKHPNAATQTRQRVRYHLYTVQNSSDSAIWQPTHPGPEPSPFSQPLAAAVAAPTPGVTSPSLAVPVAPPLAPVIKRVNLSVAPAVAFDAYVGDMAKWWPLQAHSVSLSPLAEVAVERRTGGQVCEVSPRGKRFVWGTVIAYVHGFAFAHSWHPGDARGLATIVQLTFTLLADGAGTQLLLMHSGWEGRGADAKLIRSQYETGWTFVLNRYAQYVGQQSLPELVV